MHLCLICCHGNNICIADTVFRGKALAELRILDAAEFHAGEYDAVILTGDYRRCVARDMVLPNAVRRGEIPAAVEYQCGSVLPVSAGEQCWHYRFLKPPSGKEDYRLRVCLVNRNEFMSVATRLADARLQADHAVPFPSLIADDLFPGFGEFGPPTLENFDEYLRQSRRQEFDAFLNMVGKSARAKMTDEEKLILFATVAGIGKFGLKYCCGEGEGLIPEELRPVRNKGWKRLCGAVAGVTLLLAAAIMVESFYRSHQAWRSLDNRNAELSAELRELQRTVLQMSMQEKLLKEYQDLSPGYGDMQNLLHELTGKVPEYMWVKSLRLGGGQMDLTVESTKDDIEFYSRMQSPDNIYRLTNLRKNRAKDNKVEYTLSLLLTGEK